LHLSSPFSWKQAFTSLTEKWTPLFAAETSSLTMRLPRAVCRAIVHVLQVQGLLYLFFNEPIHCKKYFRVDRTAFSTPHVICEL
jgi:hypothetical protein